MPPKNTSPLLRQLLIFIVGVGLMACSAPETGTSRNGNSSNRGNGGKNNVTAKSLLDTYQNRRKNVKDFRMVAEMKVVTKQGDTAAQTSTSRISLTTKGNRILFEARSLDAQNQNGNRAFGSNGRVTWMQRGDRLKKWVLKDTEATRKKDLKKRKSKLRNLFHPYDIASLPNTVRSRIGVKVNPEELNWTTSHNDDLQRLKGSKKTGRQTVTVDILLDPDTLKPKERSYHLVAKAGKKTRKTTIRLQIQKLTAPPEVDDAMFDPPE